MLETIAGRRTASETATSDQCGGRESAASAEPMRLPVMMPRLQKPWQVFMISVPAAFSILSASTLSPSSSVDRATPTTIKAANSAGMLTAKAGSGITPRNTAMP